MVEQKIDAMIAAHEAVFGDPEAKKPEPDQAPAQQPETTPTADTASPTPQTEEAQPAASSQPQPEEQAPATPEESRPAEAQPTDQAGAPDAGTPEAEASELEKLRNYAKATEGRLQAMQQEVERLKLVGATPPQPETPKAPTTVEIPDKLKAEAEEFDRLYPDYAPLLRADDVKGERLRRILEDLGADSAGLAAENIVLKDSVSKGFQAADAKTIAREQQEHMERVVTANPELRGYVSADATERAKTDAYMQGVEAWIAMQPYDEAVRRIEILQRGSSTQINTLLAEYKKIQAEKQNTPLDADTKRRASLASGVDNRRGAKPKPVEKGPEERVATAHHEVFGD